MTHEDFMREAIKLSQEHMEKWDWWPFGCVIVKDWEIVWRGWNKVTSSNDPTAHAEMVAIRDASQNLQSFLLEDCDLYTSCEPCPMCYGAISWARIKKIYYANTEEDAAAIGFDDSVFHDDIKKDFDKRDIPVEQILRNEANIVFQWWKEKEDKIEY